MLSAARALRQARLQTSVEELMTCIIRAINDKKGHIPPVSSPGTLTFPFDITISG
jgi:autophagy-related protein 101